MLASRRWTWMWTHFEWIDGPHRLAIMQCPSGGDALDRDLRELRAQGVDRLVSVMEPDEAAECGLSDEAEACGRHGIAFETFPIRDHSTPGSPEDALRFSTRIAEHVRAGEGVVIHCFAGVGRSATMALVTMRILGFELDDAVKCLSRARGFSVPETPAQLRWVGALELDEPGAAGRDEDR